MDFLIFYLFSVITTYSIHTKWKWTAIELHSNVGICPSQNTIGNRPEKFLFGTTVRNIPGDDVNYIIEFEFYDCSLAKNA